MTTIAKALNAAMADALAVDEEVDGVEGQDEEGPAVEALGQSGRNCCRREVGKQQQGHEGLSRVRGREASLTAGDRRPEAGVHARPRGAVGARLGRFPKTSRPTLLNSSNTCSILEGRGEAP